MYMLKGFVLTHDALILNCREVLDGIQSIIHLCAGSAIFDAVQVSQIRSNVICDFVLYYSLQ